MESEREVARPGNEMEDDQYHEWTKDWSHCGWDSPILEILDAAFSPSQRAC